MNFLYLFLQEKAKGKDVIFPTPFLPHYTNVISAEFNRTLACI